MSATLTLDFVGLHQMTCGECAGVYAIAEKYRKQKWQEGGFWHCPYCQCSWGYATSEITRLKRTIVDQESFATRQRAAHDQTRAALRETERRRRAEKGAKTKLKKRIAAGVCPCCNRSFQNVRRHMANKHPEFTDAK